MCPQTQTVPGREVAYIEETARDPGRREIGFEVFDGCKQGTLRIWAPPGGTSGVA